MNQDDRRYDVQSEKEPFNRLTELCAEMTRCSTFPRTPT